MSDRGPAVPPETLERARRGEEEALERLVEAAYPFVRRWALVHTGDPAEADDLTQDVLITMIRTLDSYRGGAAFSTWLYSVTRNAAMDRHRRVRRRQRLTEDDRTRVALEPTPSPSPSDEVEREQLRTLLTRYLRSLPERQREVFDLVELQGMATAQAAELMGIEPVSVRAHLFKARRHLRAVILAERSEVAEGPR